MARAGTKNIMTQGSQAWRGATSIWTGVYASVDTAVLTLTFAHDHRTANAKMFGI
jgi:hypothetical protein